jgi:CheY-like chemotaxis protein
MRILVVEDDPTLRIAIKAVLRSAGHVPVEASDGAEAWEILHDEANPLPDVIVLDLMMPKMDGAGFRARQLGVARLAGIPTIVMTAGKMPDSSPSAFGGVPIFVKPFALHALLAGIDAVVHPPTGSKRCACGQVYDEIAWRELVAIGEVDNGREVGERLELRNCKNCGSTMAWEIGRHAHSVPNFRIPS